MLDCRCPVLEACQTPQEAWSTPWEEYRAPQDMCQAPRQSAYQILQEAHSLQELCCGGGGGGSVECHLYFHLRRESLGASMVWSVQQYVFCVLCWLLLTKDHLTSALRYFLKSQNLTSAFCG